MDTPILDILLVEDDPSQIKLYNDSAETYSFENSIAINFIICDNVDEAIELIKNQYFDAAILDLKLRADTPIHEGNLIAKEIINNLRFPVFIVSGFEDLDETLKSQKNFFFRFYLKGQKDLNQLFEEIVEISKTGIVNLLNQKGEIDRFLTRIFRTHIVNSMPYWVDKAKERPVSSDLLRYVLSHLYEFLEASEQGVLHNFHAPEFYIKSPIKVHEKTVFTGDIVKKISDNSFYVVMTPLCDLVIDTGAGRENPKADFITLVRIESEANLIARGIKSTKIPAFKSNQVYSHHYLPNSSGIFEGGFINFQALDSVLLSELLDKDKYIIEISISGAFRKDITARFANYYGRQGQPVLIS